MTRFIRLKSAGRNGFTLVEILVTVAIIGVLAGVLLPALYNQLTRGDMGRTAQDLSNLRTGAETFGSDTHRLPGKITHLIKVITTSDTDIFGQAYPASVVARWKGPYVNRDVVAATGGGATFVDDFVTKTGSNSTSYLAINLTSVTLSDFAQLEAALDEGNTSSSTSSTTGAVRYSSTISTLTFLMVPLQP